MEGAWKLDEDGDGLRDRARRLRWRLSGAWQVPTFILATLVGALLLHLLPLAGQKSGVVGGFLFCGFANLTVMALLAPGAGRLLRRRRPALPKAIAVDRAGSLGMVALLGLFAALGVRHHPAVVRAQHADAVQLNAVRRYLVHQAPAQYAHRMGSESVWKQTDTLYRTCIPGNDPDKNLCLFVDLSGPSPAITVDHDQQPNAVVAGPDNPGRRGG